ncbi:hypothetical protein [Nonomuraea dietziae]
MVINADKIALSGKQARAEEGLPPLGYRAVCVP